MSTASAKHWEQIRPNIEFIKDIVTQKQTEESKQNYFKYIHIYNLARDFAITKKLIAYGGTAINELLPPKDKIYGLYDLHDYDFFSDDAKGAAENLADYLKKKQIEYVEVKQGLHMGTYRVFAEFQAIADITHVNHNFYMYLLKEGAKNPKTHYCHPNLHVAPIAFIKWSFYKELCSPESALHRWEKVFTRYLTFMKHYPDSFPNLKQPKTYQQLEVDPEIKNILTTLRDFIQIQHYTIIGGYAMKVHNKEMDSFFIDPYISSFEIMTDDVEDTTQQILQHLTLPEYYKIKTVKRSSTVKDLKIYFTEMLPPRTRLFLVDTRHKKEFPLLTITLVTNNCFAHVQKHGFNVGTFDTILQFIYAYYMTYSFFMVRPLRQSTIKSLFSIIESCNKHPDHNKPSKRFSTVCYGKIKTVINAKKELWNKRKYVYRP